MKIIVVSGGSYKSCYINYLTNVNNVDLLIFNYGLIYDYDLEQEIMGNGVVTKELMALANHWKTIVVAGVYVNTVNSRSKVIIVCDGDKIHIHDIDNGAKLNIKNHTFVVGDERTDYQKYDKIILSKKRINPNIYNCSKRKILIFIDEFGLNLVENGKLKRNFNKYSKIILK